MRNLPKSLALLGALSILAAAPQDKIYSNSYKGKTPPEITNTKGTWINTKDGKALTLKDLKGKVVWLEFSFLT